MKAALRDAFLSALVALGLFAPLIGLKTDAGRTGLVLTPRPVPVAVAVGAAFVGRLLLLAWRGRSRRTEVRANRALAERLTRAGRFVAPVLLLLALVLPFSGQRYYLDLGVLVTYVMLGWGLNIVVGYAGLLDLGYVFFFALGAYSLALLTGATLNAYGIPPEPAISGSLNFYVAIPIVMVIAACELVIGLGIIVAMYRNRLPIDVDEISELRG